MQKDTVEIRTEFITMDKLLKFSGVADTGGQAFMMVEDGVVRLNGQLVTEKRKKVHPGDVVNIDDQIELTVAKRSLMKINSLYAVNFRNYESCSLKLSSMINVFYGQNAQGKTNLLEAIFTVPSACRTVPQPKRKC